MTDDEAVVQNRQAEAAADHNGHEAAGVAHNGHEEAAGVGQNRHDVVVEVRHGNADTVPHHSRPEFRFCSNEPSCSFPYQITPFKS